MTVTGTIHPNVLLVMCNNYSHGYNSSSTLKQKILNYYLNSKTRKRDDQLTPRVSYGTPITDALIMTERNDFNRGISNSVGLFNCTDRLTEESVSLGNCSTSRRSRQAKRNISTEMSVINPCKRSTTFLNGILAGCLVLIIIITVFGNVLVICTIVLSRNLRKQLVYYFISFLALSDTLFAAFTVPVKVRQFLNNQQFCMNISLCYYMYLTDHTFSVASITNLLAIATERVLGIAFPYHYDQFITKRRCWITLFAVWLYSTFLASLSVFDWSNPTHTSISIGKTKQHLYCINNNKIYYTFLYSFVVLLNLFLMVLAYGFVFATSLRHAKIIRANEVYLDGKRKRKKIAVAQLKVTRTVTLVFIVFLISYLPVCIITLSSLYQPEHYRSILINRPDLFHGIYIAFIQILPLFNSCLNPFIYAFTNSQFRQTVTVLYQRIRGQYTSSDIYQERITSVTCVSSSVYSSRSRNGSSNEERHACVLNTENNSSRSRNGSSNEERHACVLNTENNSSRSRNGSSNEERHACVLNTENNSSRSRYGSSYEERHACVLNTENNSSRSRYGSSYEERHVCVLNAENNSFRSRNGSSYEERHACVLNTENNSSRSHNGSSCEERHACVLNTKNNSSGSRYGSSCEERHACVLNTDNNSFRSRNDSGYEERHACVLNTENNSFRSRNGSSYEERHAWLLNTENKQESVFLETSI